MFQRYRGNPILSPNRWPYTVNAVMNAGAAEVNGTTVLLCRVEDRRGLSHLAVARSADGLSNWVVEQPPLLEPEPGVVHDSWGLEDARLTWVPELDRWVIAYVLRARWAGAVPGHHGRLPQRGAARHGTGAGGQERRAAAPPDR